VLLATVFVIGALLLLRAPSGGVSGAEDGDSAALSGAAFKGNPGATVVIDAYEDFLCPFCLRFFQSTESPLLQAYGDRIKFVFHDFPQEGPHPFATKASEAARCAGDQGKYWEMHGLLYSRQGEWGYKGNSVAFFKRFAAELGLDTVAFNACLDSDAHRRGVLLDMEAGRRRGVAGTPTFIVNGQTIVGAQPFNVFANAIESALGLEAARAAAASSG
jgi:protein-disulfide isomerase